MATIPPVEILEARYPIRFTQWALRNDSGGAGKHRGGLGGLYEIEVMCDAKGFLFGERGKFAPPGVVNGESGALNEFTFDGKNRDGTIETGQFSQTPEMVSKITGIELKEGQRVRLQTPGGGGYGVALERSVADVQADLKNEFISTSVARKAYGVVIDSDGVIDANATAQLRTSRLQELTNRE